MVLPDTLTHSDRENYLCQGTSDYTNGVAFKLDGTIHISKCAGPENTTVLR